MTLHKAIELVIKNNNNKPLTASQIADEVNRLKLFVRKDGLPIPSAQIHARVNNYKNLFFKKENLIYLLAKEYVAINKSFDTVSESNTIYLDGEDLELDKRLNAIENLLYTKVGHTNELKNKLFVVELSIALEFYRAEDKKNPELRNLLSFIKQNHNQQSSLHFDTFIEVSNFLLNKNKHLFFIEDILKTHYISNKKLVSITYFNTINETKRHENIITPNFINSLLVNLTKPTKYESVYDPACGFGSTLLKALNYNPNLSIFGDEWNRLSSEICSVNLFINNFDNSKIQTTNAIQFPSIKENTANVIISVPPFSERINNQYHFDFKRYCNSTNSVDLFVELMLSRLNKLDGRMAVVVPDGFLNSRRNLELRKHLINKNILESVISLPNNSFQNSSVKTSILLVNYNKSINQKGDVLFINSQDSVKFRLLRRKVEVNQEKLDKLIKNITNICNGSLVSNKDLKNIYISNSIIINENYDLQPNKYTSGVLELINEIETTENLVNFGSLVNTTPTTKINEKDKNIKFINIKDLKEKTDNFYLNLKNRLKNAPQNYRGYRVIDKSSLLIAIMGNKIYPTYFDFKNEKIAISHSIIPFTVDITKVNVEYLLSQLNSEFIASQISIYREGNTIPRIPLINLKKIKIPLPSLAEQYNRLAHYKKQEATKFKLTQFIKEINLVSNYDDIKKELIRFVKKKLPHVNRVSYLNEFDNNKFPFSEEDIAKTKYIKRTPDNFYKSLLLIDDNKKINGYLILESENDVTFEEYTEINAYANFIINASANFIEKNTNKLLNEFSHTTKNILLSIDKVLNDFLETKNNDFLQVMKTSYLKEEDLINRLIKSKNRKKEDFLAINRMKDAKNMVTNHIELFANAHKYYTTSVNSNFEEINLSNFINQIIPNNPVIKLNNSTKDEELLFIKRTPIEFALTDIIDNAVKYSKNEEVQINITSKERYVQIEISNFVETILSEKNYERLGKEDLKKDNGTYSTGLSYAYKSINEHNKIELIPYKEYKEKKTFKIIIKLKKV